MARSCPATTCQYGPPMKGRPGLNKRLDEAVRLYLQRIENEGQSKTSITTASYALARLQRAVATRRDPNPWLHDITPSVMDDYCYGPAGIRRNIRAVSFNRYRSVLIVFFNYGILMRWCDTNPMDAIGRARPDAPTPKLLLSASELIALLDYCSNPIQRIACAIGMNTGLRGNDMRHLTIFDASLTSGVIQTEIRKTRKLDVKAITADLRVELTRWYETYAKLAGLDSPADLNSDWYLVPSYRINLPPGGRPGSPHERIVVLHPTSMLTQPWMMVKRPLARMGYPTKGEGFHTLRRSSARALFESLRSDGAGRDHALMIVKDYLNHASVVQTEHYLGLNHERAMRDALLKDQPFLSRMVETEQERLGIEKPRRLASGG